MQNGNIIKKDPKTGPGPERFWYALYTKPRSEFKAAAQLEEVMVEYYLPAITVLKQWSDRKKKITEPLMRGYIFIKANESERLLSLEQQSIVRCVFDRGRAAKIPEWQIDNVRKMLSQKQELKVHEGLVPGQKVEIKDGPFEGIIGVVQYSDDGKSTIAVSIDLLNRSIITYLPKDSAFEVKKD